MPVAIHHLNKRKRTHEKYEDYPIPNKFKRFLDKAVLGIGILAPLGTLPQIIKIWVHQNVTGLSVITWISFLFGAIILLFYSIVHREKPLIVMYSCLILVHLTVIIGILLYS